MQNQHNNETHIVLVDLQKAFDSVDREDLFNLLEQTEMDTTVTNILKSAYSGEISRLILQGTPQKPIRIEKGVRQGACSSPILFNLIP